MFSDIRKFIKLCHQSTISNCKFIDYIVDLAPITSIINLIYNTFNIFLTPNIWLGYFFRQYDFGLRVSLIKDFLETTLLDFFLFNIIHFLKSLKCILF